MTVIIEGTEGLLSLVGQELPPSEWILIDQGRVDGFAEVTEDRQWIHVDPRAASEGPYSGTIAHGYLTLSLITYFWEQTIAVRGFERTVNYGMNHVRFPAPAPVGGRIRARFQVTEVIDVPGGHQAATTATIECDKSKKPVCVADTLVRYYR